MSADDPREDDDLPDVALPLLPGGVGATGAPPIPPVQPIAEGEEKADDEPGA